LLSQEVGCEVKAHARRLKGLHLGGSARTTNQPARLPWSRPRARGTGPSHGLATYP
jgi:hypothetical protein